MQYLTDDPLDRQALIESVMRHSDGALVVFSGVVRNHHKGRSVVSITYEAYRPMAEKEIARIVDDVSSRFPEAAIAVRHRVGLVMVGEESIVIVCCSPHRNVAYEASRELIDRIKKSVPIWKKERTTEGEEWVDWQWT